MGIHIMTDRNGNRKGIRIDAAERRWLRAAAVVQAQLVALGVPETDLATLVAAIGEDGTVIGCDKADGDE